VSDRNPNTIRAGLFPGSIRNPSEDGGETPIAVTINGVEYEARWAVVGRHGAMFKRDRAEAEKDARIGARVSAPRRVARVYIPRTEEGE
jgi:hypothetical protein